MDEKQKSRARYKKWYESNKEHARKCKRENMRKYRAENPEKYNAQSRAAKKRIKDAVFAKYGTACTRCGFKDVRALTLDHVLNNGAKERAEIGERGVYKRAIEGHESEYQILCMNCQFIKRVEARHENQH
jgi:hypothetical protein